MNKVAKQIVMDGLRAQGVTVEDCAVLSPIGRGGTAPGGSRGGIVITFAAGTSVYVNHALAMDGDFFLLLNQQNNPKVIYSGLGAVPQS